MTASNLSLQAIIPAIAGLAVPTGHPSWGAIAGLAILLLALGIAAGVLSLRSRSEGYTERKVAGKKISNSLVSLSSAAILAVYAAGYHRTSSAAEKFDAQTARRKAAPPIAAKIVAPAAPSPTVTEEGIPIAPHLSTPPPRKDLPRPSTTAVREAEPDSSPAIKLLDTTPSAQPTAITPNPVVQPSAPPTVSQQTKYKDGTYSGWGTSRHGDIQASVVIQDGKIVSAAVTICATRYSCSWIADLPGEVLARQSANVDYVTGASESTDAFADAVSEALLKASE